MEVYDYREARRSGMRLGLMAGGTWIASFLIFVYTFPSLIAELGYLLGLASIGIVGWKLRRMRQSNKMLTLFRCWWISWFTFMCAVLLTSAVQYLYFAVLDHGHLCESIMAVLQSSEIKATYAEAQATDMLTKIQEAVNEVSAMPVKDIVMSLMTTNIILGFIFSGLSLLFLIGSEAGERSDSREYQ